MVKQVNLNREEGGLRGNSNRLKMRTMRMVGTDRRRTMKGRMKKDRKTLMEVRRSSMTSMEMKYLKKKLKNTCVSNRINTVKMVKEMEKAAKTKENTGMEMKGKTVGKNTSEE